MAENILDAYLQIVRRVYPEKTSFENDDLVFQYGVDVETDKEVLYELERGLSAELAGILVELRHTRRSLRGKLFGAKKLTERKSRHERAINYVGERIQQIEKCGW